MKLPPNWTTEDMGNAAHCKLINAPDGKGMVTVDFKVRGFRPGYNTGGPTIGTTVFAGRGWKAQLVEAAVAWLAGVLEIPVLPK